MGMFDPVEYKGQLYTASLYGGPVKYDVKPFVVEHPEHGLLFITTYCNEDGQEEWEIYAAILLEEQSKEVNDVRYN